MTLALLVSRYTTMALPYFSRFMNQFRVAASMLVAYVSVGSMVLAGTQLSDTGVFSFLWFSAGAVVVAGSCGLPMLRYVVFHLAFVLLVGFVLFAGRCCMDADGVGCDTGCSF